MNMNDIQNMVSQLGENMKKEKQTEKKEELDPLPDDEIEEIEEDDEIITVNASVEKLVQRINKEDPFEEFEKSIKIIMEQTKCDYQLAQKTLVEQNGNLAYPLIKF